MPLIFRRGQGASVASSGSAAVIFFTDLIAGPKTGGPNGNGCLITAYGRNFGSSCAITMNGASCHVISVSQGGSRVGLDKAVFEPTAAASTGNIVLTPTGAAASNGVPFAIQSGNIYFVDESGPNNPGVGSFANPWRSPSSCFGVVISGDIVYLRTGTYNQEYDDHGWGSSAIELNSDETGVAWIRYPGDTVTIEAPGYPSPTSGNACFLLRAGSTPSDCAATVVVAGFVLRGNAGCIDGGGSIPTNDGHCSSANAVIGQTFITLTGTTDGSNIAAGQVANMAGVAYGTLITSVVGTTVNLNAANIATKTGVNFKSWLPESHWKAGTGIRYIDNECTACYGSADVNTYTGLLTLAGDTNVAYGNDLIDTGSAPAAGPNNHGLYLQNGADNLDVGWNRIKNLRMGHTIQLHGDYYFEYLNFKIHDNITWNTIAEPTTGNIYDYSRGTMIGGSAGATYGALYNNIYVNCGVSATVICVIGSGGNVNVFNETLVGVAGDATDGAIRISNQDVDDQGATASTMAVKNCIVLVAAGAYVGAGFSATFSQVTVDYNVYSGNGNGPAQDAHRINAAPLLVNNASDWHLQAGSPAKAAGTNTGVVYDYDGYVRPRGAAYSIGAYE